MYTKSLATQHLIELVWKMRSLSFFSDPLMSKIDPGSSLQDFINKKLCKTQYYKKVFRNMKEKHIQKKAFPFFITRFIIWN